MKTFSHASLFSGIGGFDLAAEWMGWENVLSCEYDPFCQKILKYHFPTTKHYGDIRQLNGLPYRGTIDILTGGFPCQPFSSAGKRRGTEDNRFLWPEMLRVIREIQPTWIIAENVRGILSIDDGLVFERVRSEMEESGYECQPLLIPACAVGAPHRRDRVWFIAHAKGIDDCGRPEKVSGQNGRQKRDDLSKPSDTTGVHGFAAHCTDEQRERRERSGSGTGESEEATGNRNSHATNAGCELRREGCESESKQSSGDPRGCCWEETWIQAAARLCRVDDGLSRRLDGITIPSWKRSSLKAYGNAIVPQVAYQIFQSIPL